MTEALADLDAALEKELSRDSEHDLALQSEESSTKVEELEKQCKTLESELDSVKGIYIYLTPINLSVQVLNIHCYVFLK